MKDMTVENPEKKRETILRIVWDDMCRKVWTQMNEIRNWEERETRIDEMNSLFTKLEWYHKHQDEVLHYKHWFLIDNNPEQLRKMRTGTLKNKLKISTAAVEWQDIEDKQEKENQMTIYHWTDKYIQTRSGRMTKE